jgi:hypothetical protein
MVLTRSDALTTGLIHWGARSWLDEKRCKNDFADCRCAGDGDAALRMIGE